MTDNNLALLFEQHHPGYMFSRHLDDLLASELACRDNTLESLVTIYRFSKSTALKASITMVAPSVPVLARKLDGDVGLLLDKDGRMVHWGNAYPLRRDAESLYRFASHTTVAHISIGNDSKIYAVCTYPLRRIGVCWLLVCDPSSIVFPRHALCVILNQPAKELPIQSCSLYCQSDQIQGVLATRSQPKW